MKLFIVALVIFWFAGSAELISSDVIVEKANVMEKLISSVISTKETLRFSRIDIILLDRAAQDLSGGLEMFPRSSFGGKYDFNKRDFSSSFHSVVLIANIDDSDRLQEVLEVLETKRSVFVILYGSRGLNAPPSVSERVDIFFAKFLDQFKRAVISLWPSGHHDKSPMLVDLFDLRGNDFIKKDFDWNKVPSFFHGKTVKSAMVRLQPSIYRGSYSILGRTKSSQHTNDERDSGHDTWTMELLGEKLHFQNYFYVARADMNTFSPYTESHTTIGQVKEGNATFALGGGCADHYHSKGNIIEFSFPLYQFEHAWVSRHPVVLTNYFQALRPFSFWVWIWTLISLVLFAIVFSFVGWIYGKTPERDELRRNFEISEILIEVLFKFVEPHSILWFPKWSTGKMLTLLYFIFGTFIVISYCSIIRSHFIQKSYENKIDTEQDVVDRGESVLLATRHNDLLYGNYANFITPLGKKISEMASKSSWKKCGNDSLSYLVDIMENGAVGRFYRQQIIGSFIIDEKLSLKYLTVSKERKPYMCGILMSRYAHFAEEVNRYLAKLVSMGFPDFFMYKRIPIEGLVEWSIKDTRSSENVPLSLQPFLFPMIIFVGVLVVGSFVFLMEVLL